MSIVNEGARPAPTIAYEWIKDFIIQLPREQDAFLNEANLAISTGTSRTPVREALLRLEAEGFLKRIPHKGAYVPPITGAEMSALMEARAIVEKWAIDSIIDRPESIVKNLADLIAQQERSETETAQFIKLDIEFHSKMVRSTGNTIISGFYASLRQRQLRVGIEAVTSGENRIPKVISEHQEILDAINSHDKEAAYAAIDAHLQSTLSAALGR